MKVKIRHINYKTGQTKIEEEDIDVLFECKHVEDCKLYNSLAEIELDPTSGIILKAEKESPYGFSVLWRIDRKNNIYEYDGFGHSGAASTVTCLLKKLEEIKQYCATYSENEYMRSALLTILEIAEGRR